MKMAVGVVDSLEEAIDHVNRHGTGHSEAIVTSSTQAAEAFTAGVDAAAVYVNASTRFTDGFEYGMGAEIGNSTQKLHARGPIGLRELTTFKYVVRGDGQVRELAPQAPAIGVLGSAFNPPHLGHLALAQEALWQLGLVGGAARADRRGAAQADRRRPGARAAAGDDEARRLRRRALLGLHPGGGPRGAVLHV